MGSPVDGVSWIARKGRCPIYGHSSAGGIVAVIVEGPKTLTSATALWRVSGVDRPTRPTYIRCIYARDALLTLGLETPAWQQPYRSGETAWACASRRASQSK